jgi:hypothetical protein
MLAWLAELPSASSSVAWHSGQAKSLGVRTVTALPGSALARPALARPALARPAMARPALARSALTRSALQ